MPTALSVVRADVKLLLNNDTFFSDAMLNLHINAGYSYLYDRILSTKQNFFSTSEDQNIVQNQRDYPVPSDMREHKSVEYTEDKISYILLKYRTQRITEPPSQATPFSFEIDGNIIRVLPPPNKASVDGLRVRYIPNITRLVDDADTIPDIPWAGLGLECVRWRSVLNAKSQEELFSTDATDLGGFRENLALMEREFLDAIGARSMFNDLREDFEDEEF